MEVLEGEYQGMKGFFQTSHGFVWGHHLGRANLMYNLRPGDVFLVQVSLQLKKKIFDNKVVYRKLFVKFKSEMAFNAIPLVAQWFHSGDNIYRCIVCRVVPGTDLAEYPANNFAGYRISG